MIKGFADKDTERVFAGRRPRKLPQEVLERAETKLAMIDAATHIEQLRIPPGNRLEKLRGDREGQWSIRINQQYRVCFSFERGDAHDVEITDYH
jgi:proteic killer suppression protein